MKTMKKILLSLACLLATAGGAWGQTTNGRIYVSLEGNAEATDAGSSWQNTTTLADALGRATAGTEVWVKGYASTSPDSVYVVPTQAGFTLRSGVQLYGGFAGYETSADQRAVVDGKAYRFAYRTVLTGDIGRNDTPDNDGLIFPGGENERRDNATHVLTLYLDPQLGANVNGTRTVVDGFTIGRGNATGTAGTGGMGGGILVTGDNARGGGYSIERCFFIENYAATRGGALYVDDSVTGADNYVALCGFFNNAAGQRATATNAGGAIALAGAGMVVDCAVFNNVNGGILFPGGGAATDFTRSVVNSTVTRNTGSGIDGAGVPVANTVVWGNSLLTTTAGTPPAFQNSAYPEATPGEADAGNIYLSDKNRAEDGPFFDAPSVHTGFDRTYDIASSLYPLYTWKPLEGTALVDKGYDEAYERNGLSASYPTDLNGNPRQAGASIDIGAFEFQPVDASRIRYVQPDGTGDGTSWETASGDLQAMIDELAEQNPQGLPGEVWVAAGEYEPLEQLIPGTGYSASFRMRDGISVYGGFAGTEDTKGERGRGTMPWDYTNKTILQAAYYDPANLLWENNRWTLTSDSRHVVWFAPMPGEDAAFAHVTTLDGVTIRGGYAQGGTGMAEGFVTDCGAGVYMDGANAYLSGCIVTQNYATADGGGVYLRQGRVQGCLLSNNNADGAGGAVYVDNRGLVHRSMLANNSARNGAAVYLANTDDTPAGEDDHPEYLVLSTCVVANNTATGNGAVYCSQGGVLTQNTIVANQCVTATDATDPNASQTGGLYVDEYALAVNNVIWNNRMGTDPSSAANIPMYARNPSNATVRFMYNAISGVNNAVWNDILQQETLSLSDDNAAPADGTVSPGFSEPAAGFDLEDNFGVQSNWSDGLPAYYWQPVEGSSLWARGMPLGQLPREVVLAPEIDLAGGLFAQKPAVGAYHVTGTTIVPLLELNANNRYTLVVFVDADCTEPSHNGSSWATAYRSLNDAIAYFASLPGTGNVNGIDSVGNPSMVSMDDVGGFEVRVLEGDLWPRYAYANEDPKTATVSVKAMTSGNPLTLRGGYYRTDDGTTAERDPLNHRSQLNGNHGGTSLEDGLYHVVTVEAGAEATLDGFHIVGGYAAGTATLQQGAGVLMLGNANLTLRDCILENNTAVTGAAVYAPADATLTMENCVVNNNTNTDTGNPVIDCQGGVSLTHVTVVNNQGAGLQDMGGTSFAAGNSGDASSLATMGAEGAANFSNPTNRQGATLGFDTYLGGYSVFRPLTSSAASAEAVINKGGQSNLTTDIMGNGRNLGGVPDLGAYEAELPRAGKVIYVRSYNTVWDGLDSNSGREESDGNPSMELSTGGDGTSWETAINGNAICDTQGDDLGGTLGGFYVVQDNELKPSSYDYDGYRGSTYGPEANCYGSFWSGGNSQGDYRNTITNNRNERYVSGLQYAVEKAAEANKGITDESERVVVWVGAGIYTDYKGFVIRDKVTVLGGFPNEGIPGETDRIALLSGYIPKREQYADVDETDYETILQVRRETPVTWTNNNDGSRVSEAWMPGTSTARHYVLYQPDVCLPTWALDNNDNAGRKGGNSYRYEGTYVDNTNYVEYEGAAWDGFTVRHGYIRNYTANRDGGAGIRSFRGVTLENMVVANNYNDGSRSRGGGLYMDGLNSRINNSFLVNNFCAGAESYGGGAYMIVGTGYNMVVANNHAEVGGGGLFIESATFYNNTVVYNRTDRTVATGNAGNGSGLFQYADGNARLSSLGLYNCIVYGNVGGPNLTNYQIASNAPTTFDNPYNCYVSGNIGNSISDKFPTTAPYNNQVGRNLPNPFRRGYYAQSENNYRLSAPDFSATYSCVNRGTEIVNGEVLDLPETDMDYTDRIKDCTVDIGAYERDNEDSTVPATSGNTATYYVTYNGAGNASGNSPTNAACWEKLQTVLNDAGEYALLYQNRNVVVKVAGYRLSSAGDYPEYHVTALSDPNDPQSYSFTVPYGVTLMGGYNETADRDEKNGWDDDTRDATTYRTILSAIYLGMATTQQVTGYHTVTFGERPEGWTGADKPAVIDGLWLTDGSATSMSGTGNPATRGGGAIVPAGAHVRNCVVTGCEATEGGGLYVLPGGVVCGTAVLGNTATTGDGIYAANADADGVGVTAATRAHLVSCTVADNTATTGGGIYLEDGALMAVNCVVWGNTAPQEKNVSGVVGTRFADTVWSTVFADMGTAAEGFYPFNNSFVETREMPSDFENASMESDDELYFADELRRLKDYSPLIKHGVKNGYQTALVAQLGVAEHDMQGIPRQQADRAAERLDAGAFAYLGGVLPQELFTRLFVSQGTNISLPDGEDMNRYLGRSFYTSFATLEDALGYIRKMREDDQIMGDKSHFEILVAGGTYKPTYERGAVQAAPDVEHDQRLYSFVVPQGVSIYGGFSGEENYITPEGMQYGDTPVTSIPGVPSVNGTTPLSDILERREFSDFNQNNIREPWELAQQTILSGQINASATEQNAYHVVYSNDGEGDVLLDGLTVMYGQTDTRLSPIGDNNEQGRGGGIYSRGVNYTLRRCRVLDNVAVRGGGIYVRDADLNLSGCILAGNSAVENADASRPDLDSRGGAVYVAGIGTVVVNLRAVNTLWANNETAGEGGAIGTNLAGGSTTSDPWIDLMNNTFVKNRADVANPVIFSNNAKSRLVNTLIWGNEGNTYNDNTSIADWFDVSYSASDVDYGDKFTEGNTDNNILLDTDNMGTSGPRFARPATQAGAEGNDATNLWNPTAISVVTDAGSGTGHTTNAPEEEQGHTDNITNGAYSEWFQETLIAEAYMYGDYARYSGPRGKNNEELCRPIDIGVYEYQYMSNFSTMTAIYVDTISRGTGAGNSWLNATDDLRGAIVGAANPEQNRGERVVYVRDGDYSWPRLSAGSAYVLDMDDSQSLSSSLTLKGSCTGVGEEQDFSQQTVVRNDPAANGTTSQLLSVSTNSKTVTIEGFTFINKDHSGDGRGINASTGSSGKLTVKNSAFRLNETGLWMGTDANAGSVLIYNTLFADQTGTGLVSTGTTTLVNTTFANNGTADMTGGPTVYNSVSWQNDSQQMPTDYHNALLGNATNDDLQNGPNFVDPLNENPELRDYRIRPSVKLLNQGSNDNYTEQVGITDTANEVDLASNPRFVDSSIDIGAYEYEAPLQQVIYVREGVLNSDGSGTSWTNATDDLQGAVDLGSLWYNNNKESGQTAYVFVDYNVDGTSLNISLPGVKVYGGMNRETSAYTEADVNNLVTDLLNQRVGLLERTDRSTLSGLTVGADAVVDGFEVDGTVMLNDGYLSTSVVHGNVGSTGSSGGILYNTLVLSGVNGGVRAVNVTMTGGVVEAGNLGNNRQGVTSDDLNRYVTADYWNYQLRETDTKDIDGGSLQDISTYINKVGHSRDIAGNSRIRSTVDNGCFETWNITPGMTDGNEVTDGDYPHGQSVVYVREEAELPIAEGTSRYTATAPFNPGFLLLKHHAGLRGNGNAVGLTNFAVERTLDGEGHDMAVMPFRVTSTESENAVTLYRYNGETRAAYDFVATEDENSAWEKTTTVDAHTDYPEGWLLEGTAEATVRFYGDSYTEGGNAKSVSLMKYNYNDSWSPDNAGTGHRFTHKENMSWNLFGSPYLCAMNYKEMAYGRMLYGYEDGGYKTVKTYGDDGTIVGSGYIPSGDAVFTQTATLGESETFGVSLPKGKSGEAYALTRSLALYLASTDAATRSLTADADRLQVNAVEADEAVADFDPMADGVKWMAADEQMPQLYAVRGAGRYSLLSAVSREGTLAVGFRVGQGGSYTIGIPEDCDAAADYEAVVLTDARTGRSTDLLAEGPYTFQTAEGGTDDSRFTLSFVSRAATDGAACRIYVQDGNTLVVDGLSGGERIRIYDARGSLLLSQSASGLSFRTPLPATGVYVVRVSGDAGEQTGKVMCE